MRLPCKRGAYEQNTYSVNYEEEPRQVPEEQTISRHC